LANPNHDNEEEFVQEVKEVCETYHQAPKEATNHRRTISIDENTGIQALKENLQQKAWNQENLNGLSLNISGWYTFTIANFDIVTGRIVAAYRWTRNEHDFCEHIRKLISTDHKQKNGSL